MKKRIVSLLLTVLLVAAILPLGALKAEAVTYTWCTRADALAWAKYHADNRTGFDVDYQYSYQCSDFATAYLNYISTGDYTLNHPYTTYNGNYYLNVGYPDGWQIIYNYLEFIPDPGDVLVWKNGEYGHVAVAIEGCTQTVVKCIQQNGYGNVPTQYATLDYVDFVGVVRPAWKTNAPPSIDTSYAGYYRCNADPNLCIRSNAGTGYDILSSIPLNATVYVDGRTPNGWAKLTYGGVTGYSSMDYLVKITHTVTFKDYNGTVLKTQTVNHKANAAPPTASRTGYSFAGWSGSCTNVTEDRTVTATYTANTYTNTIKHWLWGFENGDSETVTDANNGGTAVKLAETTFSATYDTTITLDSSKCITPPNGCKIGQRTVQTDVYESRDTYCPVYGNQNFPYQHKYQSCGLTIEYEYEPVTYTISYTGLEGAANPDNPTTYNVLYGVTLSAPAAREGYTFEGWYSGDTKVTGINEGKTARFATVQELRDGLAARQVGDIALEARWSANIVPGDVNNDGIVESGDYVLIKKVLKGTQKLDKSSKIAADMNKDGVISAADCAALAFLIRGE